MDRYKNDIEWYLRYKFYLPNSIKEEYHVASNAIRYLGTYEEGNLLIRNMATQITLLKDNTFLITCSNPSTVDTTQLMAYCNKLKRDYEIKYILDEI